MRTLKRNTLLEGALPLAIVVLAAWLRLSYPDIVLFEHDEAEWSNTALRIARGEEFPLVGIRSLVWVATGPAFLYLLAIPMLLSEDAAFVTAFIGLLNVIGVGLTFLFARRYFGNVAAVVASLLYATNPWAIYHSRKIWNPDVLPLFSLLFFWGLFLVVVERRPRYLALAAAACAVAVQLNQAALVFVAILGLVVATGWRRLGVANLALAGLVALLISAPYLYHQVRHDWVDVRQALRVSGGEARVDLEAARHLLSLSAGWGFPGEVFGIWEGPGESVPAGTEADWVATGIFLLGVAVLAGRAWRPAGATDPRWRRWTAVLVLAWLAVPVLAMTRHGFELHLRYLLLAQPAHFVAGGVGMAWLGETSARRWDRGRAHRAASRAVWALALAPVLFASTAHAAQYSTVLRMIDRNGLERSYGVPVRHYRQAFQSAAVLAQREAVSQIYVWVPERNLQTVRYWAEINHLRARIATEPSALLLGPDDGEPRLLVTLFAGEQAEGMLSGLGFEELEEERVPVTGGQSSFTFYRLSAENRAAIEPSLSNRAFESRLENGLALTRWSADRDVASPGSLRLAATWRVWREPPAVPDDPDFCLFQHLVGADGGQLAVKDYQFELTRLLRPGDLIYTSTSVEVPAGVDRQQAWLDVGQFSCWKRAPVRVLEPPAGALGEALRLGPFKVGGPRPTADTVRPRRVAGVALGDDIRLLGYDLQPEARAGDSLAVTLFWLAERPPAEDLTVTVQLLKDGLLVAQRDNPPRGGTYPTSLWDAGEVVVDDYLIPVPSGAGAGEYLLIAGLYTPSDVQRLPVTDAGGRMIGDHVVLGSVRVR